MPGRWGCPTCGSVYAAALHGGCPRHPGTQLVEEDRMPKITVAGGASNPDAEPGQPGYTEPAAEPEEKPRPRKTAARRDDDTTGEGGDGSSPGSSSQTSTGKPTISPRTNDDDPPKPAPTTGSRSVKDRAGSSTAGTTAGSGRGTGRSEK